MSMTIYLGNKNYSSWSLRPWLALKHTGAPFEEVVIPLDQPDTHSRILRHSPSGRVPALLDGDLLLWESIAMCEYLAERFPEARLWPEDRAARAHARAVSAEMHAGFATLRSTMPMNLRRPRAPVLQTDAVRTDVERIVDIWTECRRSAHGGEFLFGRFSIADAMFAPVVTRFHGYAVELPSVAQAYVDSVRAWPAMREWTDAALREAERVERYEPHTG